MLKRYQILLDKWMEDHYKKVAQKYDVSFSEMIRMALCVDIMNAVRMTYPEYNVDIDDRHLRDMVKKKKLKGPGEMEELHKFLSKLYFEARKAAEFLSGKEDKIKEK